MGSVSHLSRVGVSCYAREWTQVVHRMGRRWPNVRVAPLIPILREDSPGGLSRDLVLLATWIFKIYSDSLIGTRACWHRLVAKTLERSMGHTPLASQDFFTIPLPAGIDPSSPDRPTSFYSNSSRPSLLRGLDQGSVGELLDSVAEMVGRDYSIPVRARDSSVSTIIGGGVQENVKRLVLVGASNLRAVAGQLQAEGYELLNLTEPGWCINPESVADLLSKLKGIPKGCNTAFVFDIFGNSSTRVALFDGTTSLPTKGAGGYHLKGEIIVCNETIFNKLIDVVLPLLDCVGKAPTVIIPPQPRYLFSGCCDDSSHCTNLKNSDHSSVILTATVKLRTVLKKRCEKVFSGPYRVVDTCSAVLDGADKSVSNKLTELPALMAKDGVHLTREGYKNMAKNVMLAIQHIQAGDTSQSDSAAVLNVPGAGRFHWRGFTSPVGSKLSSSHHGGQKWGKGRPHHNNGPYVYKNRFQKN